MMNLYTKEGYYQIGHDIESYPDAVAFFVIGGRGTGKTYGTLKYMLDKESPIVYVKRTKDDVDLICASGSDEGGMIQFNPYEQINRDYGYQIVADSIKKGFGAFYDCTGEEKKFIGYITALSAVANVKGFEMQRASWQVFDEFIPLKGQRISKSEGTNTLDLYETVNRSRDVRGADPLRMIFLANSTSLNNQIFEVFDLIDTVQQMKTDGKSSLYLPDRFIFIRLLDDNEEFQRRRARSKIFAAVGKESSWSRSALANEFAFDDDSMIEKHSLSGWRADYRVKFNDGKMFYVYRRGPKYYLSSAAHTAGRLYDCDTDGGKQAFREKVIDLRWANADGDLTSEKFSFYAYVRDFK